MNLQHLGDGEDEFVRITDNVKGFQGIFSQYGSQRDISPIMHSSLDAVILSVIVALSTTSSINLVSRGLKSIEEAISSRTEHGQVRRALEAPGDVEEAVFAFKRFGNMVDTFQVGSLSFWWAAGLLNSSVA
jgi:hypothetical protein